MATSETAAVGLSHPTVVPTNYDPSASTDRPDQEPVDDAKGTQPRQ